MFVFFFLFGPALGVIIWYETVQVTKDGFLDSSFAIAERSGSIAVTLALVLYLGTEGIEMLAEIFRRQRAERFRREGRAQLVDELEREMEAAETLEDAKELIRKARELEDGNGGVK